MEKIKNIRKAIYMWRLHKRMTALRRKVAQRKARVSEHVYVQSIYIRDTQWRVEEWLCIDGVRVEYFDRKNECHLQRLHSLQQEYYKRHKREI